MEIWKFCSLAQRSSVQILAQTRWINEVQSVRTESELDFQNKERDAILKQCMACFFRFKSRQLASFFSQWKYKVQFMHYMESFIHFKRSSIGANESSSFNHDTRRSDGFIFSNTRMASNPRGQILSNQERESLLKSRVDSEEDENIDESEDQEEKILSKQRKIELMQNTQIGMRSSKHDYNFTNPTADLEQLPYQIELFRQILQSPNKDFGRLMKHSSDCSIQYYNDSIVNEAYGSKRVSELTKGSPERALAAAPKRDVNDNFLRLNLGIQLV